MATVATESIKRVNFQSNRQVHTDISSSSFPRPSTHENSIENVVEDYTDNVTLYPLKRLIQELTAQEKQLWDRTMGIHLPVEGTSQLCPDEELLSVGGVSMFGHGSQAGIVEPSMTYLIRYGQLTSNIHRYFRKLEKEHACLHLSGRRANFENLRLPHGRASSRGTPVPQNDDDAPVNHSRRKVHSLKDEELVVYRCAIMCAQFPMLSAPGPPDDRSPSPPLPPPLLSHTAPSESSIGLGTLIKPKPVRLVSQPSGSGASVDSKTTDPPSDSSSRPDSNPYLQEAEPIATATNKPNGPCSFESPRSFIPISGRKGTLPNHRVKPRRRSYSFSDSEDENDELNDGALNRDSISAYCDPLGQRDHPFPPMVNRDMLCSLVRRAFNQTEEQQVQYEQILRHEYSRKSKGEILARELVTQLQVLEKNAHPFYRPRNFVTRNGYDIWLQGEKQRIKQQLDKFWHFNLPSMSQEPRPDYHKAYATLLEKIICCESRTSRREPVHGGRTPSSQLSDTAQRLLTEFGLRYGIGELYQRIVYLDYLAKHFDYEIWYISHCTDELRAIRNLIPRNRTKMTATRREMELLRGIVHHLHGQTDNSLTRIDRLFLESEPQIGVAALINLLKEVLEAEQSLSLFGGQRIRPIEDWLKKYLKDGFVLRYERRKEIISDEILSARNLTGFPLTPILINALLQEIKDEVKYYRDNYQNVFRPYFNIVPYAKMEFYRLTCADACQLCGRLVHDPISRQRLNLEMLGLLYRLDKCDNEWSNDIPTDMQQWRNDFVHLALIWMDVFTKQVKTWVLSAIKEDQWTVLTFAAIPTYSSSPSLPSVDDHGALLPHHHHPTHYSVSPFSSIISPSIMLQTPLTPHSQSAFTAVQPLKSYREVLSPMSEVSGAVSDLTSSHSSFENISIEIIQQQQQQQQGREQNGVASKTPKKKGKSSSSQNQSYLKFGKAVPHSGGDSTSSSSDTPKLTNHITAWEDQERGDVPPLVPPERDEDNLTPHVSPVTVNNNGDISTTEEEEEEEEVKIKPFTGLVPSTSDPHITAADPRVVENGFNSSESETPPLSSLYRRSISYNPQGHWAGRGGGGGGGGGEVKKETKLKSKSFDTIPKPVNKLPSHPPPISVLHVNHKMTEPTRSLPPASGVAPTNSATSVSTDQSQSPSLNGPSPSLSTTSAVFYTFPVSNAPIDLFTIFIRLGSFIGNLMEVLTPKVRQGLKMGLNETAELPSEVNQIRRFLTDIRQQSENMRVEFLKKIHKIMVSNLKLYADNLLCMDLCYLPQGEAKNLFGEEMIHHLQRRNETEEIWGCRHIVEANHGLHPNGLPCIKKTQPFFDSITRDMCIRINNIHLIIKTFSSLESHIYTLMVSPSNHAPFGHNLSSEPSGSVGSLDVQGGNKPQMKTSRPFPHRYRPEPKRGGNIELLPQDNGSDNTSGSIGLTPVMQRRSETGFNSTEAQQLIEYLEKALKHQLQMMCLRMNKFFKPALTLLLDLKLGDCPINRRLNSLVEFLTRHMRALSKHLYPKCYSSLIDLLWQTILQDIEEEALKLRNERTSIYRAQLLLQTVTHLIKVVHDKGQGLSLDTLTTSTEYLLALIDVYLRPTSRLIKTFERLTGPQFTQAGAHIQLDQSPVPLSPSLLHQLSTRLHNIRKCFRGDDFVRELIKLGNERIRHASVDHSNPDSASNGAPVSFTVTSATQLGQYLLDEGILICLLNYTEERTTPLESSSNERMNAINTSRHVGVEPELSHQRTSPEVRAPSNQSYGYSSPSPTPPLPHPPQFMNGFDCWYKFTDLEDSFEGVFFHGGQILSTCIRTPSSNNKRRGPETAELSPFDEARLGTLHLILDVLQQRSRKDTQAKTFLLKPNAILCSQERGGNDVPPHKIFRI
ncbi:PREDICTED: uncharacterized protein LOC109585810 isoform X2 [Amphimedon queenslandica]|uniref:MHD2 domain-containing protein n=1 Tax=Amphimedon queenslandica TaxID=400682 RepID=A0AAN0JKH0_AMPQE|nr:PREDICTED: uncharacterized protein LOC109585810 isoform X2 [Amphimedon queenslandica]|eukprot:XP_019857507.1 PREDICTED: uncharacterized protein LOC109585810 isoform X2 [Amphimedon queenslandica]